MRIAWILVLATLGVAWGHSKEMEHFLADKGSGIGGGMMLTTDVEVDSLKNALAAILELPAATIETELLSHDTTTRRLVMFFVPTEDMSLAGRLHGAVPSSLADLGVRRLFVRTVEKDDDKKGSDTERDQLSGTLEIKSETEPSRRALQLALAGLTEGRNSVKVEIMGEAGAYVAKFVISDVRNLKRLVEKLGGAIPARLKMLKVVRITVSLVHEEEAADDVSGYAVVEADEEPKVDDLRRAIASATSVDFGNVDVVIYEQHHGKPSKQWLCSYLIVNVVHMNVIQKALTAKPLPAVLLSNNFVRVTVMPDGAERTVRGAMLFTQSDKPDVEGLTKALSTTTSVPKDQVEVHVMDASEREFHRSKGGVGSGADATTEVKFTWVAVFTLKGLQAQGHFDALEALMTDAVPAELSTAGVVDVLVRARSQSNVYHGVLLIVNPAKPDLTKVKTALSALVGDYRVEVELQEQTSKSSWVDVGHWLVSFRVVGVSSDKHAALDEKLASLSSDLKALHVVRLLRRKASGSGAPRDQVHGIMVVKTGTTLDLPALGNALAEAVDVPAGTVHVVAPEKTQEELMGGQVVVFIIPGVGEARRESVEAVLTSETLPEALVAADVVDVLLRRTTVGGGMHVTGDTAPDSDVFRRALAEIAHVEVNDVRVDVDQLEEGKGWVVIFVIQDVEDRDGVAAKLDALPEAFKQLNVDKVFMRVGARSKPHPGMSGVLVVSRDDLGNAPQESVIQEAVAEVLELDASSVRVDTFTPPHGKEVPEGVVLFTFWVEDKVEPALVRAFVGVPDTLKTVGVLKVMMRTRGGANPVGVRQLRGVLIVHTDADVLPDEDRITEALAAATSLDVDDIKVEVQKGDGTTHAVMFRLTNLPEGDHAFQVLSASDIPPALAEVGTVRIMVSPADARAPGLFQGALTMGTTRPNLPAIGKALRAAVGNPTAKLEFTVERNAEREYVVSFTLHGVKGVDRMTAIQRMQSGEVKEELTRLGMQHAAFRRQHGSVSSDVVRGALLVGESKVQPNSTKFQDAIARFAGVEPEQVAVDVHRNPAGWAVVFAIKLVDNRLETIAKLSEPLSAELQKMGAKELLLRRPPAASQGGVASGTLLFNTEKEPNAHELQAVLTSLTGVSNIHVMLFQPGEVIRHAPIPAGIKQQITWIAHFRAEGVAESKLKSIEQTLRGVPSELKGLGVFIVSMKQECAMQRDYITGVLLVSTKGSPQTERVTNSLAKLLRMSAEDIFVEQHEVPPSASTEDGRWAVMFGLRAVAERRADIIRVLRGPSVPKILADFGTMRVMLRDRVCDVGCMGGKFLQDDKVFRGVVVMKADVKLDMTRITLMLERWSGVERLSLEPMTDRPEFTGTCRRHKGEKRDDKKKRSPSGDRGHFRPEGPVYVLEIFDVPYEKHEALAQRLSEDLPNAITQAGVERIMIRKASVGGEYRDDQASGMLFVKSTTRPVEKKFQDYLTAILGVHSDDLRVVVHHGEGKDGMWVVAFAAQNLKSRAHAREALEHPDETLKSMGVVGVRLRCGGVGHDNPHRGVKGVMLLESNELPLAQNVQDAIAESLDIDADNVRVMVLDPERLEEQMAVLKDDASGHVGKKPATLKEVFDLWSKKLVSLKAQNRWVVLFSITDTSAVAGQKLVAIPPPLKNLRVIKVWIHHHQWNEDTMRQLHGARAALIVKSPIYPVENLFREQIAKLVSVPKDDVTVLINAHPKARGMWIVLVNVQDISQEEFADALLDDDDVIAEVLVNLGVTDIKMRRPVKVAEPEDERTVMGVLTVPAKDMPSADVLQYAVSMAAGVDRRQVSIRVYDTPSDQAGKKTFAQSVTSVRRVVLVEFVIRGLTAVQERAVHERFVEIPDALRALGITQVVLVSEPTQPTTLGANSLRKRRHHSHRRGWVLVLGGFGLGLLVGVVVLVACVCCRRRKKQAQMMAAATRGGDVEMPPAQIIVLPVAAWDGKMSEPCTIQDPVKTAA